MRTDIDRSGFLFFNPQCKPYTACIPPVKLVQLHLPLNCSPETPSLSPPNPFTPLSVALLFSPRVIRVGVRVDEMKEDCTICLQCWKLAECCYVHRLREPPPPPQPPHCAPLLLSGPPPPSLNQQKFNSLVKKVFQNITERKLKLNVS